MSFYATLGYRTSITPGSGVDGSILLASAMPRHQLVRRKWATNLKTRAKSELAHLQTLLFDPQLYLAGLDAGQAPSECTILSSYPWFGATSPAYSSGTQKQTEWKTTAKKKITSHWEGSAPTDEKTIRKSTSECVALQLELGCEALILPGPLTINSNTTYAEELLWLDLALEEAKALSTLPTWATIALSDQCLRFSIPSRNKLLEMIADAVTARPVSGVYIVIEQGGEPDNARHCANSNTLGALLRLIELISNAEPKPQIMVNFTGPFGLVATAFGADRWASGWYKGLQRLRLADKGGDGRAFPSYWSRHAMIDIHLQSDLDAIAKAGLFNKIADITEAAKPLHAALAKGKASAEVGPWAYRQANIAACTDHFFQSCSEFDRQLTLVPKQDRATYMHEHLKRAEEMVLAIQSILPGGHKTQTRHSSAWRLAVQDAIE